MISLLVSMSNCKDAGLANILNTFKNFLTVIQIIAPILLMIMASVHLFNLMKNPDNKKLLPRIKNSIIAAIVIFFIPLLVNVLMQILGSSTTISDCWNGVKDKGTNPTYMDPNEGNNKNPLYLDPSEYK